MSTRRSWIRDELLVAFNLYCQIPFGRLHSRNAEIVDHANLLGRTPSALAMKLVNIASLDPIITRSGRTGLKAASKADKAMWLEMTADWEAFAITSQLALENLKKSAQHAFINEISESAQTDYSGKEITTETKSRVGQNFFRKAVLSSYDDKCCITGLRIPELLVASHIIPWRDDIQNRLNPSNGLCLSSLHDKAFDKGLISFSDNLELMLSARICRLDACFSRDSFEKFEGKTIANAQIFAPKPEFIAYHRANIFIGR